MFAITERLLLRPGWAEDAPALVQGLGHESVIRNTARVPRPYRLGDAEQFLALPADPFHPRFLITLRDSGTVIGGIGIAGGDTPELGYWLAADRRGQGYATEAGRAIVAIADHSLRLPGLVASHMIDNPASGAVLRKLGFTPGGTARRHSLARGGETEVRLYTRPRLAETDRTALAA